MSLWAILGNLFIGPLKLLFEFVFQLAYKCTNDPGVSIVFLSLVINVLVLPLYRRADVMQEQARDTEARLARGAAHIKKAFSGDERMMVLQTYYRQNHYSPTGALNGSVSLLLEIPFFMAAYQFLSGLAVLQGAALGPIADLSACDRLLPLGSMRLNLLPFVMTAINLVSSWIYLRGYPLKTKIQLYGMSLFFLVFLYRSPSGLVFYWTLNNLFSLGKTIYYKLKGSRANARRLAAKAAATPDKRIFLAGSAFLTILIGVLIPSNFIAASPQEYVDLSCFHHPLWYIAGSSTMASGAFLIWLRVFYWLASERGKVFFDRFVWVLCGVAFTDYMFFGTKLGILTNALKYEKGMSFSAGEQLLNLAVLAVLAAAMLLCAAKARRVVVPVLLTACVAAGAMSAMNLTVIRTSIISITAQHEIADKYFSLSRTGRNVVVIMLDRAMGEYIPYLIREKPELKAMLAGFTYYSNTISFGSSTNFGAPPMLGGYEYTPVEMNRRSDRLLVEKHNEALLVVPLLFADNGYEVTVCDPPYPNYSHFDLSLYNEYPQIRTHITKCMFNGLDQSERLIRDNHRNFFCFSLMKSLPLVLQGAVYDSGRYNQSPADRMSVDLPPGVVASVTEAAYASFMDSYLVLTNLSRITDITDEDKNTYLFLSNDTTHSPIILQEPDYVPAMYVDNTEYDAAHPGRFTVDGRTLDVASHWEQLTHYHANMSALLRLGEWFDDLRRQGVYDNTRIIIVSDHGRALQQLPELLLDDGEGYIYDKESYFPLLMVKDFGAAEFTISDEFMTNADVPSLAMDGLIGDPINPFTGNRITGGEKTAHDQYIIVSEQWDITQNNGETFLPDRWARVHDNLWDPDNWQFYHEGIVLDEYAFPDD